MEHLVQVPARREAFGLHERGDHRGRISIEPYFAVGIFSAQRIASSRSLQSTRKYPPSCSCVSANGPSVIYVFNDGSLQHTYPDGTKVVKTAVSGALVWDDAEAHETTNIGGTDIHSLKIELKTT